MTENIDANAIATFPTTHRREHCVFIPQPLPVMTDAERDAYVAAHVTYPDGWQVASTIPTRTVAPGTGWNIRIRFVAAPIYFSLTAYQTGFGSAPHKSVCGQTKAERAAVKAGAIVIFDCGRMSGGNNRRGTTLRQLTFKARGGYWNPRVPSAEVIAAYERKEYEYLSSDEPSDAAEMIAA